MAGDGTPPKPEAPLFVLASLRQQGGLVRPVYRVRGAFFARRMAVLLCAPMGRRRRNSSPSFHTRLYESAGEAFGSQDRPDASLARFLPGWQRENA